MKREDKIIMLPELLLPLGANNFIVCDFLTS